MGISADLFVCNSKYYDVSSIGMLSHATGGSLFVMPQFSGNRHGAQLVSHVQRVITRTHGYDGMMRVRASMGR
jgi:protein transport protein SEC24